MFTDITSEIHDMAYSMTNSGLLGAAIACTLAGLVIWLSGLGMPRLSTAAATGFIGFFTIFALPTHNIQLLALAILAAAVIGMIMEMLLSHFIGFASFGYSLFISLFTSACGSVLIMLGMIFLLSLKGANPVNHINQRQNFYLTLLFALIAFGTFEQLIFCRKIIRPEPKVKSIPDTQVEPTRKSSWRNV
ncbi:MAG: hypothetical protein WC374_09900 [Phycisphaerae bacterium]